jgi:starch phosphorylase
MNDMHEPSRTAQAKPVQASPDAAALMKSYAISAALFSGSPDALYERHLKYDNIVEPETANTRERYKAAARAVRDILSDRWLSTNKTYARETPKRIYYISIEFLIGRSLGNNVMNLLLDPIVGPSFKGDGREWWEILHEEPDAGLGNGGLGRLPPASWTRWPPRNCQRWATACAMSMASSAEDSKRLAGGAAGQLAR